MEFKDFDGGRLNLEDFDFDAPSVPTLDSKSTAQVAGSVVLADPANSSKESFRSLRDNLQTPEGRSTFVNQQMLTNSLASYYNNNIDDILTDDQLTDEQKKVAVDIVRGDVPNQPQSTLLNLALERALTDEHLNAEDETNLLDVIDSMDEVIQSRIDRQNLINGWRLSQDTNAASNLVDFGEYLVPFAEVLQVGQLSREFGVDEVLMGNRKKALSDLIKSQPIHRRAEFTQALLNTIDSNNTLVFSDGNTLHAIETLEHMAGLNDYSNFERWFDNTVNVLEFIGLAWTVKAGAKAVKSGRLANKVSGSKVEAVHTDVSPAAPSQVLAETSPETARVVHAEVVFDSSDEIAQAMYGTNRTEALAKDKLPEPARQADTVPNKVKMEPYAKEEDAIRTQRTLDGRSYYSEADLLRHKDRLVDSFDKVEGFVPHHAAMTLRTLENGNTLYTIPFKPIDTGYRTADRAVENALYALRSYGATADDLTLFRRTPDGYVETTTKELSGLSELRKGFQKKKKKIPAELKELDYVVALKYEDAVNPADIVASQPWITKRNWLDRLGFGTGRAEQGSLQQHFLDPASYLPPELTRPASAGVDKAVHLRKLYVDMFNEQFVQPFQRLSKDRKTAVEEYIKDANLNEIKFSTTDLRARGFDTDEIKILEGWRRAQDQLWYAANADLAQTLRARGFSIYTDTHGTHLVVKQSNRNQVSAQTQFYNSATNTVETMSKSDLDDFYNKGGTLGRLSEPTKIGNDYVEYVKVVGTPNGGYLRAIKSDEVVLHYRDGYYPTMYDANWFVEKIVKTSSGDVTKVVSTARNGEDARHALKQLRATAGKDERFEVRADRRETEYAEMNENSWKIAVNSNMSSQKVRGERLTDASVDLHKMGHTNLVDPLEATARQIGALSERVVMRDYFEAVKKRWVDQYFDELGLPLDKYGQKYFPDNVDQIVKNPETSGKLVSDAKSTFNYIHSLQNGWANTIDNATKAVFNFIADTLDAGKHPILEKWARDSSKGSLPSAAKAAAFKLYLAANPMRQALIQGHQSVQLFAIAPKYMMGGIQKDWYRLSRASMGYKKDKEALEMWKELERSGLREAVDANNLVRQNTLRLVDSTVGQKAGRVVNAPFAVGQKVGFDVGERWVLYTAWLAQRHLKLKEKGGKALTRFDYDEIHGKARAFTYDMNRAGDMPYNQNTLSVIAQFLQVPHKAILQPLFNRSLSRQQRGQLLAWNTAMYGVPTGGIFGTWFYNNVEEGPTRDALEHGLEDLLLNRVVTATTGEKQSIDWGDLSPVNAYGLYETMHGMFTSDLLNVVAESPSASLLFGNNPRLTNAMQTTARWIVPAWNYEDPELQIKYTDVAIAFANTMSGASNAFKGVYALESNKFRSSLGNVTDEDVTKYEATMKGVFGLRTHDETARQEVMQRIYKGQDKAFTETDVTIWYNELKRMITRRGMNPNEVDIAQRILSEGYRVFSFDKVEFRNQLHRAIQNDVKNNGINIYEDLRRMANLQNTEEVRTLVNMLPKTDVRDSINRWIDALEESAEDIQKFAQEGIDD